MSDSGVGDQQMLITVSTNFQNFVDVPFISTCGRYPVHERFPLSSSSSFAFNQNKNEQKKTLANFHIVFHVRNELLYWRWSPPSSFLSFSPPFPLIFPSSPFPAPTPKIQLGSLGERCKLPSGPECTTHFGAIGGQRFTNHVNKLAWSQHMPINVMLRSAVCVCVGGGVLDPPPLSSHSILRFFLYRNELYYCCCCWSFHVFCLTSVFSRDRIRLGWRPWMSANDFRGHLPICWRDLFTVKDSWYEKIKEQTNLRINQQSKMWIVLICGQSVI